MHKKIIVICGHYGCGKTNYAVNLAVDLKEQGEKVILCDMDIVNPYFRSADQKAMMSEKNIELIVPRYAGTNVDIPVIPEEINRIFEGPSTAILDVGGDDAGAVVLGRFHEQFSNCEYELRYVVNHYRSLTQTSDEAVEVLHEIEKASRVKATSLVINSHLKELTTADTIAEALDYAGEVSKKSGLPIGELVSPYYCYDEVLKDERVQKWLNMHPETKLTPVHTYVKTPWETGC